MNPWPMVGMGLGFALAPYIKEKLMYPFIRTLKRWTPDCWLKTVLFFEIGQKDRRTTERKTLDATLERWRNRSAQSGD